MTMKSAVKRPSTTGARQGATVHLANRMTSYAGACEESLAGLRVAIESQDGSQVETLAHSLTDCTLRIGALHLMKLCIALQMVGRRGLFPKAHSLLDELESEYGRFKESLMSAVG